MSASIDTLATPENAWRTWEDRLAGPMFFLALMFLIVAAGLIHRLPHLVRNDSEYYLILGALGILWPIFIVELALRFRHRDRNRPTWKSLLKTLACGLLPPLRMGCRSQVRHNHIWLPGLGWQEINNRLRRALERIFSFPMIFVALMVLPLLAIEYYEAEKIRAQPILALWLDIGTSVIWLAFAIELIIMVSVSDRPWRYCFLHWIDVTIVLLPIIEALALFRLLRLGRILRVEQLLRWGRLTRLQALASHGWRAFLLLQIVQRLTGRSLERQHKRLQELLLAKEEEVTELRQEIKELEQRIEGRNMNRKEAESSSAPAGTDPIS